MLRCFLNPGHAPDGIPDPGASGHGLRESDVVKNIADLVEGYLVAAGVEVVRNLQSDSLHEIVSTSNNLEPDIFVSIHCNAADSVEAKGTETWFYFNSTEGARLAECIQTQIVESIGTVDRGIKGAKPGENGKYVLTNTDAVAVLVETAFISNEGDARLLEEYTDDFARAIARGITDYGAEGESESGTVGNGGSKYFGPEELMCHGASQGHCNCGIESAENVDPRLLELLDQLRENIGGPLELSCAYRCRLHNDAIPGSVPNSQHVYGTAADVQTPNFPHCHTPDQLYWYCAQLPFDGIGIYDWGCHVDVRSGGTNAGFRW